MNVQIVLCPVAPGYLQRVGGAAIYPCVSDLAFNGWQRRAGHFEETREVVESRREDLNRGAKNTLSVVLWQSNLPSRLPEHSGIRLL